MAGVTQLLCNLFICKQRQSKSKQSNTTPTPFCFAHYLLPLLLACFQNNRFCYLRKKNKHIFRLISFSPPNAKPPYVILTSTQAHPHSPLSPQPNGPCLSQLHPDPHLYQGHHPKHKAEAARPTSPLVPLTAIRDHYPN